MFLLPKPEIKYLHIIINSDKRVEKTRNLIIIRSIKQ